MGRTFIFAMLLSMLLTFPATAAQSAVAIILKDQVSLRAAPRDSAPSHAIFWQGEMVEVRGERLDYLQVYDYRRERAGFVRMDEARRLTLTPEAAPELHAVVRFLRSAPDSEALGIGFAAAYIQAAPAAILNSSDGVEVLDALGAMADRLAQRASTGSVRSQTAQTALSGHLETAMRHGVAFVNTERDGRVQICYDGDAFRHVLALASTPEQRARAALALTRLECTGNESSPLERKRGNEWRAEVLDRVNIDELAGFQKNRVLLRRAALWSGLAYQRARLGEAGDVAAKQALSALSGIDKNQLTDADTPGYADAAMRVNASRWGAIARSASTGKRLHIVTEAGAPGETCVLLLDKSNDSNHPLAKRCTYAIVWANSATVNRENTALALAVQPTQTWRELWLFRKLGDEWSVHVLPPATTMPDVGYVEFAGWIPGGTQMLVAREASGEGKYRKSFEQISLDSLTTVRKASEPSLLSAFRRWQDAGWKAQTLSLR